MAKRARVTDSEAVDYLAGMNPEQCEGVEAQDGRFALLAVAGAGKTRVLVHRIARMVADGVPGDSILAVTFSVKAKDEMNARLRQLGVSGARVGTWHSLCIQILKEDRTQWSTWEPPDGEGDRGRQILKEVLGYKHMKWAGADATKVASYIGRCKANLIDPGTVEALQLARAEFGADASKADEAHARHCGLIAERRLLTFDDFIVFAHRHLSVEENRQRWAGKWSYMLVDEQQDDNLAQKTIRELLCREHGNVMCVGDVAQAIYSFRGSKPDYLKEFSETEGVRTIVMNRNYRSGSRIIEVANAVIRPAAVKLPADMVAERGTEGRVDVMPASNLDAEGQNFGAWVEGIVRGGGRLSDVCALFRTNAQSRALEEALLSRKIPYVVVGGTSFYERKEVKDLLGYLRVASGRDATGEAINRCINAPFRFLGSAFVERVMGAAKGRGPGPSWTDIVRDVCRGPGVQGRQVESALGWARIVEAVGQQVFDGVKPGVVLNDLVGRTRYVDWLEKEEGQESVENSRSSNVRELVRVAERFATAGELLDYIDETVRASRRQREDRQAGGERVLLMSVHKSKGLEWPHVFVSGCNEKILPHARGDIEEERRLMYVAVTRARDSLVLSYVDEFATRAGVMAAEPSRFLKDAGLVDQDGNPVDRNPGSESSEMTLEEVVGASLSGVLARGAEGAVEEALERSGEDEGSPRITSDFIPLAGDRRWLGAGAVCGDCGGLLTTHGESCAA